MKKIDFKSIVIGILITVSYLLIVGAQSNKNGNFDTLEVNKIILKDGSYSTEIDAEGVTSNGGILLESTDDGEELMHLTNMGAYIASSDFKDAVALNIWGIQIMSNDQSIGALVKSDNGSGLISLTDRYGNLTFQEP